MTKQSYIYILTNKIHTVLYIGVTEDLIKRVWQHQNKILEGFTSKYNINKLVYYEVFENIQDAITREKQLKNWRRQWKIQLIKKMNPKFIDLYKTLF